MKGSGIGAWFVYIAVRMIFALMQIFPIDRNLRTARLLARIWIWIMPRHRDRAVAHLRASYGNTLTEAEIQRIAHKTLESTAMFAVEAVCLPRLVNAFTWTKYIELVRFNEAIELAIGGTGMIMVTAHYGSFELIGHTLATLGFDIVAIMRPIDNDYINRFIIRARRTHGLVLLDKKGAMTDSEEVIRRGGMLAFIADQDAGRKGCFVDFFGRPASTYKSIALLAMETRVPIVVGYVRRRGDVARYEVGVERIIHPHEWDAQPDPMKWISQAYTSAMESFIRARPEQYWWIHRRWKSQPGQRKKPKPHAASAEQGMIPARANHDVDRSALPS